MSSFFQLLNGWLSFIDTNKLHSFSNKTIHKGGKEKKEEKRLFIKACWGVIN